MKPYKPHKKQAVILDAAWAHIQSVPNYKVSTRWLFYRLYDAGFYQRKEDYAKWKDLCSRARRRRYQDWQPNSIVNDTRHFIQGGHGADSVQEAINGLGDLIVLNKWRVQDTYVMLWYEARAMTQQFRYYTRHMDLMPMGGWASVEYRERIADHIETCAKVYGLPIVVLYFGDLDKAGLKIAQGTADKIAAVCSVPFKFIRCGLTMEQVQKYGVTENFEHPGNYQWESLTDAAAREIITDAIAPFFSHERISPIEAEEKKANDWLHAQLAQLRYESA